MANFKSLLLAATIVAGTVASPAFAQQIPLPAPSNPDASLRGAGASSIQNVLVRALNCIGIDNRRGASTATGSAPNGTLTVITPGNFIGTPALNCAGTPIFDSSTPPVLTGYTPDTTNLQVNAQAKYVSTGSGFGRRMWRDFGNDFSGGTGPSPQATVFNPFVTLPANAWSNLQYAFSDTIPAASDIVTYNTRAAPTGGAAISFPLFILPVAIAYNSRYGTNAASQPMVFNAKGRGISVGGVPLAAIKLSKAAYCGIFNGTILNWNDRSLMSLNTNKELFDPATDTETRWLADGAPIRLVGRMDKSGTTDIFTRHLNAVCNETSAPGIAPTVVGTRTVNPGVVGFKLADNKYARASETLPYDGSTGVNFRSQRSDSDLFPAVTTTLLAGSTNMISGDYWNGSAIVNIGTGNATFPSVAGPSSAPTGKLGSGLYIVADGSGRVSAAVNLAPDYALNGVMLNGKVTYISSDFVQPSIDSIVGMTAATLQIGTGTLYANPTATAGRAALGSILPPQTDSAGIFAATDTRLVHPVTGATKVPATRDNPLAWGDVLYADTANTLAAPTVGYPMTGTTSVFLYTCYKGANREAMVNTLGYILGQNGNDGSGNVSARGVINGVAAAAPGIMFQSNIGVVPTAWQKAIVNTFLSKSVDAGALNLWIQDRLLPLYQTATPDIFYGGVGAPPATVANPATKIFRAAKLNVKTATNPNSTCTTPAVIGTGTAAAPQFPAVVLKTGA